MNQLKNIVKDCITQKIHLRDCDNDGYCNNCGSQEGAEFCTWEIDQVILR